MRQVKRPRVADSWVGQAAMAVIFVGVFVGILLPLSPEGMLTYWTVFGVVAGILLVGLMVACVVEKCWVYLGILCAALAILLMAFVKVILPNIK